MNITNKHGTLTIITENLLYIEWLDNSNKAVFHYPTKHIEFYFDNKEDYNFAKEKSNV